jgi:plastocyanin
MTIFFAISLALSLILTGLVWRFGAWALALTAVLMLLNLAMSGPFMIEGFRFPDSFFDFAIALFSVSGNLLALGGAVVALVARRRGAVRGVPTPGERTAAGALVAALVALAAVSGVLTLANRESVSAEAKAGALPVRMQATRFVPERLEASAGRPVRVLVSNGDPGTHSFTIAALDTDLNVSPGSERLVELADVPAGEYQYVCKLFGHEGTMKGTLVVRQ